MHIHPLSQPPFLRLSPTAHLARLVVKFFHHGTRDGCAVPNATFPIVHHHPPRTHPCGALAPRAAGKDGRQDLGASSCRGL